MDNLIESWCKFFPNQLLPDVPVDPNNASQHADPYSAGPSIADEKYYIRRIVGSGSSGTALVGRRVRDSLSIIAKILDIEDMDERQRERTRSEILCLSQCSHPSIIQYLSHHEEKAKLLVVMELADAGDMGFQIKYRRQNRALFLEHEAAFMMTQIFLAVDYIHSKSILHRDIKPANVFVKENGIVKIGDFGLSRMFEESVSNPVANSLVGTPYYIAPEVWKQERYGKRADLFSIGVMWFEMLTLERPFRGDSIPAVKTAILSGNTPLFPPQLKFHPDTVSLITHLLSSDPQQRPTIMEVFMKPLMEHSLRIFSTIIIEGLTMSEQAKNLLRASTKAFREKVNAHFLQTYRPKLNLNVFTQPTEGDADAAANSGSCDEFGNRVFVSNIIFLDEGRKWKHRAIRLSATNGLEIGKKGAFDSNHYSNNSVTSMACSSSSNNSNDSPGAATAASPLSNPNIIRTIPLSQLCKVTEVPRCLTENRDYVFSVALQSDEALWFYSGTEPAKAFATWTQRFRDLCGLPESFEISAHPL